MTAPDNLAIWNALSKTDPKHTKPFNRAGGFKGTAIKPIWIVKMLTEHFGPCGKGWGIDEPSFQVVPCGDETLVYCTVRCWYDDGDEMSNRSLYGVGGDKVATKRSSGPFNDDEAFKKAFTDAVNNAFKFVGVGADIHMGLFEDNKYVRDTAEEFSSRAQSAPANDPSEPAARTKLDGPHSSKTALRTAVHATIAAVRAAQSNEEIDRIIVEAKPTIAQARRDWPSLIDGDPKIEEDGGLKGAVEVRRVEVAEGGMFDTMMESMRQCATLKSLTNWMAANESVIDQLDDIQRRRFEKERDAFEAGLLAAARVNAG